MNIVLIFDLASGFNDMVRAIICLTEFMTLNDDLNFTIRYCNCRPQTNPKKWNWYEATNLFDEKTFIKYRNYIPYSEIREKMEKENTYDFFSDKIKNKIYNGSTTKEYRINISKNMKQLIINSNKEYIIVSKDFHIYSQIKWWTNTTKDLYNTLIPSKKVLDEYNRVKMEITEPYNFIHYRYEEDMREQATRLSGEYNTPKLDLLIEANLFKNNNYKIYVATSVIEQLNEKGLMDKPIDLYPNILYKKGNLEYFDENAFVDFLIGMESEEIFGFSSSSFSHILNNMKGTQNYYDKINFT